jgi:hypothetical protein
VLAAAEDHARAADSAVIGPVKRELTRQLAEIQAARG